jgi:hypothetical protein
MHHRLPVVVFISIIVVLSSIIVVASAQRMSFLPTQLDRMITQPQVVPTTSNPTISIANGGLRTMANTSFENTDSSCGVALNTWAYIRMDHMRGWKTAHPAVQEKCNAGSSFGTVARVIELNYYTTPPDGTKYASLNADVASFLYQTLCVEICSCDRNVAGACYANIVISLHLIIVVFVCCLNTKYYIPHTYALSMC